MIIQEHISLASFSTFRVGGEARFFVEVINYQELQEAVLFAQQKNIPIFVLGGGSNLLIADQGFNGLIIKISIQGIAWVTKNDEVFVTAGAGVVWDDLVLQSVERGLWGLENLSYIPGTVGASPVQNIGAYGVEVKDVIYSVKVFDIEKKEIKMFSRVECQFGYRDSVFKKPEGKKLIVLEVIFCLSAKSSPCISYKDVQEFFSRKNIDCPTLREIREAVVEIRKNKLPDWHVIGTAGSFFKNPIITKDFYHVLSRTYPELPFFNVDETRVKIPLAWILDKVCGLKGYREGDVGLYEKQPLALVNYGGATSQDVYNFAQKISYFVKEKTGINAEWEVERIGVFN